MPLRLNCNSFILHRLGEEGDGGISRKTMGYILTQLVDGSIDLGPDIIAYSFSQDNLVHGSQHDVARNGILPFTTVFNFSWK